MSNKFVVGNVISIHGTKITILMNEHSNLESFYYNGVLYDGISIGVYLGIIRGSNKIIAKVEKEFLEDKNKEKLNHEFARNRFERRLEVSLIGNFYHNAFEFGIKKFPMIFNEVVLLTEDEIKEILHKNSINSKHKIPIGKSLSNEIPIELRWDNLFNTHIGIFGNTGSGKSNTLTKIYSELFNCEDKKEIEPNFKNKSKFFIIDFNGEYIEPNVFLNNNSKKCLNLCSSDNNPNNKLPLSFKTFLNIETLWILYSVSEKTQRPFLLNSLKKFIDEDKTTSNVDITLEKIKYNLDKNFKSIFSSRGTKEMLDYFHNCLEHIEFKGIDSKDNNTKDVDTSSKNTKYYEKNKKAIDAILNADYDSSKKTIYVKLKSDSNQFCTLNMNNIKDDNEEERKWQKFHEGFVEILGSEFIKNKINNLSLVKKIKIAVYSNMISVLLYRKYQVQYIQPLIARIEEKSDFIEKTIKLVKKEEYSKTWKLLNVISLKNCNTETKKNAGSFINKATVSWP